MPHEYCSRFARGKDAEELCMNMDKHLDRASADGWEVVQLIPISYEPRLRDTSFNPQFPLPPVLDSFQVTTIQVVLRRPISELRGFV